MKLTQARIRTIYLLLAMLAVLLPMSGWYAKALTAKPVSNGIPLSFRTDVEIPSPLCVREAVYRAVPTHKVNDDAVRH